MESGLGFAYRQNGNTIHIFRSSLGVRVKVTHGIQLIPKELHTNGHILCRRINVQNTAANRKLSRAFHHTAAAIAGSGKPVQQIIQHIFLTGFQPESGTGQHLWRHGTLAEGFPGKNLDRGLATGKIIELTQTLLLPASGNHSGIIQSQIPGGQNGNHQLKKCLQFLLQTLSGHIILTDDHQRTLGSVGI